MDYLQTKVGQHSPGGVCGLLTNTGRTTVPQVVYVDYLQTQVGQHSPGSVFGLLTNTGRTTPPSGVCGLLINTGRTTLPRWCMWILAIWWVTSYSVALFLSIL